MLDNIERTNEGMSASIVGSALGMLYQAQGNNNEWT
jgi:hypothetical protein